LATAALFALKPLTTLAKATSHFTGITDSYGKLFFLHTANAGPGIENKVMEYIKNIKNKNGNAILLNACNDLNDKPGSLSYDASVQGSNDLSAISGEYKIIQKGKLRTGVITAKPGERDIIEKINTLSAYLKNERNCTIVVCLSQLGFKNKNAPDDITLANDSTHLDIIISGHAENFPKNPFIALSNNGGEVIIHSAAGDDTAFGKIEIDFNEHGQKKHICFGNSISDNRAPGRSFFAA
jgi:2',3'-cyclic-nucleotide 2'-phosphodiesterase (5'-nucleotidase family)